VASSVQQHDVNATKIAVIGVVSVLLVFVIIVGVQAWFYHQEDRELERKATGEVNVTLADLRLKQQENINRYRWVDRNSGTVTIPIDRAIELAADRLSGSKQEQAQP
jgi:hypothetical protein